MLETQLNRKNKPGKTKAFFICLVFAFTFWLIHDLGKTKSITLEMQVEYKNMPAFLLPINDLPDKLSFNVSGSGLKFLINSFYANRKIIVDFNQIINLKNLNRVILSSYFRQNSPLPFNLKITGVYPDTLYFAEPKGSQKNAVVKTNLQINCKAGYGMAIKEVNPKFITLYGSKYLLQRIDTVYSESMQLFDVDNGNTYKLKLIKLNDSLVYSTDQVTIITDVQRLIERTVVVPIRIKNSETFRSAHCYPNSVSIKYTLMQNEQILNDSSSFAAEVLIGKGPKHPVLISTKPGGASIISISPREVELVLLK